MKGPRPLLLLAAMLAVLGVVAPAALAEEWRSEQPPGEEAGPTYLGEVGDIECWNGEANRCLLITAGNGGVQSGLFAYDGSGWYRYSTVCGGHEGRIAWAGPEEFWTISDQQAGQETGQVPPQHISLCHFVNGQVIASYAEPVGQAGSYLPMSAAACAGPSDCWFAGERLPAGAKSRGAFHLHWDGSSLTAVPSLLETQEINDPGRSVVSLAVYGGRFYEGVRAQEGDIAEGESPTQPSFVHQIPGSAYLFEAAETAGPISFGDVGATPEQMEGFQLAGDDAALWAISGANKSPAKPTVLRKQGSDPFRQVPLSDPSGVIGAGFGVGGVAVEPGTESVWVGFRRPGEKESSGPARLAKVNADGTVGPEVSLPAEGEELGPKGSVGPIACPAIEQCWMATRRGWLFHLGPDLPQDTDPALHALVTYRPPDDSLPFVPPVGLPEDDSGESSPFERRPETSEEPPEFVSPHRQPRALLANVQQRVIGGTILELSFLLRGKAHVKVVAKRRGAVVAATKRYTLGKGRQRLRLRLDPKRWPTKIDLQVHALKGKAK
jgi:hypothetical protein